MTGTERYDLAVAYRIYPRVSGPALDLAFGDDKYSLAEACLRSFKDSLGSLQVKLWAILDGCPPEYEALFRKYFDDSQLVVLKLESVGNQRTFATQIELLLDQSDAELVYFAEDDYLYLADQFSSMVEFLRADREVQFLSPFDHPDCYQLALHRTPKWIKTCAGRHWRTASSTCLTFLTRKETLAKYSTVFQSYVHGNFDSSLWLSLTKQRVYNPVFLIRSFLGGRFEWKIVVKAWLHCWRQILFGKRIRLWVPVPGIATHLDAHSLSPGVDWQHLMLQSLEENSGSRHLCSSESPRE
jgi:hypothetical protein